MDERPGHLFTLPSQNISTPLESTQRNEECQEKPGITYMFSRMMAQREKPQLNQAVFDYHYYFGKADS